MYICGAPAHTYGPGGVPAELAQAGYDAATVDPAPFGVSAVSLVFGPARYRWPPPNAERFIVRDDFTDGLDRFYEQVSDKTCPASMLLEIRGATVLRNVVHCTNGLERRVLYETFRPNDRAVISLATEDELAGADVRRFDDPEWNCLYIGSAGSFNYGHWLVDDLPRAKAAAMLLRDGAKPLRIVLPAYGGSIDKVRIESLRTLLGCNVHVDLLPFNQPQYFPSLYFVTPITDHPLVKSPIAMDYATRAVTTALFSNGEATDDGRAERIFVGRAHQFSRTLISEEAVKSRLVAMGFRTVDPGAMSFADQARTFSQASVVVGQMGAAMANTLFCRPTTAVIHLAPRGWIEPFYLDLAAVRGHRYSVLYGDVTNQEVAPHLSDFSVDVDSLARAIDAL